MKIPYTVEESETANREWMASCGHHSIASAAGVSLADVKAACSKLCGWMSPTMIEETLLALGCRYSVVKGKFSGKPASRINERWIMRVQFEGSWLKPGVPAGAAYQRTHYIAAGDGLVMDTMRHSNVLCTAEEWENLQAENVAKVKSATGYYFTHLWQISK